MIRNARVVDHHWTAIAPSTLQQVHEQAEQSPVAYLMTYWAVDDGNLHVWALPEDMAYAPFCQLPIGKSSGHKTVEIFPGEHRIAKCDSPDFSDFYVSVSVTAYELSKLLEAIKLDDALKKIAALAIEEDEENATIDEESEETLEPASRYTSSTIAFLEELPQHTEDPDWHTENKKRYELVLRDPTRELVEQIRTRFIEQLSPEVAGGKRHLSILKKNDYGKSGYHNHYWFAFYDPHAGSKTRSVQLFFRMLGNDQVWRYGFSMGNYCDDYLERLHTVLKNNADAVAAYMRGAPEDAIVRISTGEDEEELAPEEFAVRLEADEDSSISSMDSSADIYVIREYPLESLLDHVDDLVDEVGEFFVWAWPLFEASVTGKWHKPAVVSPAEQDTDEYVDEDAPKTLDELCQLTSLPRGMLQDLQEALLTKQQVVLVGPPGTSKTFIAQQFARYFVRERAGHLQGTYHTLYMHANWTYEDFFEGIKPVTKNDTLLFEPKKGFFLDWVTDGLKGYSSSARHVLVLDEINRCDTAAVLGELLQLLEYRGATVRLLSGRQFVFPRNVFVIGTMNSADRSIGRMDMALRRRFLWLNLHPQVAALKNWLQRPGNNPVKFDAAALEKCNGLLANRGIPAEQHIGHALFMLQQRETEDETPSDAPLTERQLRRIVKFSVIPYLQELFLSQFGQADQEVMKFVEDTLLECLAESGATSPSQEESSQSEQT
ncbi:MAG: AAA family ATPase [Planctomycetes bacterium]|nr:AAA family ATPase [Planctomycetota bacterium]MBL7039579.1 AAA family ATPase [Pirellulaceae bacterium]